MDSQSFKRKASVMEQYYEPFPLCPDFDKNYRKLSKIGQGTFGKVFKGQCQKTGNIVALKKVKNDKTFNEGFPITALREVAILKKMDHENVVKLIQVAASKGKQNKLSSFYLVLEFCHHDLAGLLANRSLGLGLGEIKNIMKQLLNSLFYIHVNNILHRDLKPSNILVTQDGTLKLADFGLATFTNKGKCYTNHVVTLWYRPPELLLGAKKYSSSVDIWGAGCIMAELWTRRPILPWNSEQKQLQEIVKMCGSITPEVWPNVEQLPLFCQIDLPSNNLRILKPKLSFAIKDCLALDMIDKLLQLDPSKRLTAHDAIDHDFLWVDPEPVPLTEILKTVTNSMFEHFIPRHRNIDPSSDSDDADGSPFNLTAFHGCSNPAGNCGFSNSATNGTPHNETSVMGPLGSYDPAASCGFSNSATNGRPHNETSVMRPLGPYYPAASGGLHNKPDSISGHV